MNDFIKYCKTTRKEFAEVASEYHTSKHLKLRTEIDNLLIAYDQLIPRVEMNEQYKDIINDYKEVIDSYKSVIKDLI